MQSPNYIGWTPKKRKFYSEMDFMENGAVALSEGKFLSAPCIIAYHCPDCKKILIDYDGNACDYYHAE